MPKCQHDAVTIDVEFVEHVQAHSLADVWPYCLQTGHRQLGAVSKASGYWSRAHIHVRCRDCGHDAWYTSADWRTFPKWLKVHWMRLVGAGGQIELIHKHYRMFQEEPCHPSSPE